MSFNYYNNKKITYCILVASLVPFILLASLKSISVGIDTEQYFETYNELAEAPFTFNKEFFFYFLTWICSRLHLNFSAYLFLMYSIASVGLFLFCTRISKYPVFLLFMILMFGYLNLAFSGIRQAISIPFLCLAVYAFIENHGWKKSIALFYLIISISFHISSILCFLLMLPFFCIKKRGDFISCLLYSIFIVLMSSFIYQDIYIFGSRLMNNVFYYFPDASNSIKTLILLILIFIYLFIIYFADKSKFFNFIKDRFAFFRIRNEINEPYTKNIYTLFSLMIPTIIIVSIGYTAIVFSRLFMTVFPFFAYSTIEIIMNPKLSSFKKLNICIFIFISLIYFTYGSLIQNTLKIVPYTL